MIPFVILRQEPDGNWQQIEFMALKPGDAFKTRAPEGIEQPWDAEKVYICETEPALDPGGMPYVKVHAEVQLDNEQLPTMIPAGMHEQELQPRQYDPTCPWCRSQKTLLIDHEDVDVTAAVPFSLPFQVMCEDCGAAGPRAKTEAEAKKVWPDRPNTVEMLIHLLNEAINGVVGAAQASMQFAQYLKQAGMSAALPRTTPDKLKQMFSTMIDRGTVLLTFKTDAAGVLIPDQLKKVPTTTLAFSHKFVTASGQQTLEITNDHVSQVLIFSGEEHLCVVPWKVVARLQTQDDRKQERPALHVVPAENPNP